MAIIDAPFVNVLRSSSEGLPCDKGGFKRVCEVLTTCVVASFTQPCSKSVMESCSGVRDEMETDRNSRF